MWAVAIKAHLSLTSDTETDITVNQYSVFILSMFMNIY